LGVLQVKRRVVDAEWPGLPATVRASLLAPMKCLAFAGAALLGATAIPHAHADAALARAQEIVAGQCFVCHGADGENTTPLFPRLAGQHAAYIVRQLEDYRSGRRRNGTMQPIVQALDPRDFAALGRWFETRPVHAHEPEDAALARSGAALFHQGNPASGVPSCASCHGAQAAGTEVLPRLAGQHAAYIERQLKAFGQRQRTNDNAVMQAIAARLSPAEMQAVAAYVSGLK
jgi:cytochrome c553